MACRDQDGQTLEILVQRKRNRDAAARLFRKLRKHGDSPRKIVTDKLNSYLKPCREIFETQSISAIKARITEPKTHIKRRGLRETKMRGFKSMKQAQRF
ncbi:MAG: DDE-type integrase/transposase/recombinase [Nitrosomonadales bacterium]